MDTILWLEGPISGLGIVEVQNMAHLVVQYIRTRRSYTRARWCNIRPRRSNIRVKCCATLVQGEYVACFNHDFSNLTTICVFFYSYQIKSLKYKILVLVPVYKAMQFMQRMAVTILLKRNFLCQGLSIDLTCSLLVLTPFLYF